MSPGQGDASTPSGASAANPPEGTATRADGSPVGRACWPDLKTATPASGSAAESAPSAAVKGDATKRTNMPRPQRKAAPAGHAPPAGTIPPAQRMAAHQRMTQQAPQPVIVPTMLPRPGLLREAVRTLRMAFWFGIGLLAVCQLAQWIGWTPWK